MFASLFNTFIVEPIFNLLVFIYAILPGHNFGVAIILFTIIVRFLMWPLVRKQLHQAKAMRELQPEIKRIKQAAKGNKQQESLMLMELYKEREINPFGSLGNLVIQAIVLIGLYSGLRRLVDNPHTILDLSYPWLRDFGWIKTLAADMSQFKPNLLGIVDLSKAAIPPGGGIYLPAFVIVLGSAISQYFQSKQLMPQPKDGRKLRQILKEASAGKQTDQTEINAAIGRNTRFLIPVMIFVFTVGLPAALGLYWLSSGLVAYWQQSRILKQDETELEAVADKLPAKDVIEGEVVSKKQTSSKKPKTSSSPASKKKGKKK